MRSEKITVTNETGLHARPASLFVQLTAQFKSELTIRKDDRSVNAKSILGILSLGISKGTEVTLIAEGPDEEQAVDELVKLIQGNFGEGNSN
ncbi:MAG: HPr family phosphocarrier protein [Peptococcaceae bacterium]|nr:HPr family phosphocarrier protein [Peptococcaceae bacterium]